MTTGDDALFEVVWPLGKIAKVSIPARPGMGDLSGKTVGMLTNSLHRGEEVFDIVRQSLRDRYAGIKFLEFHLPRGWDEYEYLAKLPEKLRDGKCDAVITGMGGGAGCALSFVRASMAAEKAGIPSVTLLASAFLKTGEALAQSMGMKKLAIAEYPGVSVMDSDEVLRTKVQDKVVGGIVEGMGTASLPFVPPDEPNRQDIVFRGTLADVQDHFHDRSWSDGMPIVPPTRTAVERFLKFTDRSPDEVLGVLPVENRQATVWSVAVNGVMAGCRPEYMPLLIAAVEAIADPDFHIEDAGATPGWEPIVIVSGPVVKELKFNSLTGALRVGRQANTSIGRFLRLYIINMAGFRIPPGVHDKGSIGATFNVALAENEDAVAELGWPSFGMDRGFARDENVVTVQSTTGGSVPVFPAGEHAIDYAKTIAKVWGEGPCAYWAFTGMFLGRYHPLLVITPRVATALAKDGWSKQDLREYLAEHVKVRASLAESWAWQTTGREVNIPELVAAGRLSGKYLESSDPDRLVPVFIKPEWMNIVVAGDPWRNQVRGFNNNHIAGVPTSKRVRLPANWQQLMRTT